MNAIRNEYQAATVPAAQSSAFKAILYAWLAAGCLDILAAFAYSIARGGSALGVLRAVASGLLGKAALGSGLDIALLGLGLHFGIMLGIVWVYWLASRRLHVLIDRAPLCGPLYGVIVYAVMNLVVLPLSAIAFKPSYAWLPLIVGIITHMLCVGLPIALVLRSVGGRGAR